jgi:hypothetical protein
MLSLAPVGWITPPGVSNGPRKVSPDRQLDRNDVPEHVDRVQLPVNAGKELAHPDHYIAQLLTPVALLARHTADAVQHPVSVNRSMKPWTSRTSPLRQVVRAAHERFGVGCHCNLPSGHRSGRIKNHLWDGEGPSPHSGDCRVLPARKYRMRVG